MQATPYPVIAWISYWRKAGKGLRSQGKVHGFRVLQFNAVVASNVHARHLYERVGFHQLGVIPGGFRLKNGEYEDICPYYIELINTVDE